MSDEKSVKTETSSEKFTKKPAVKVLKASEQKIIKQKSSENIESVVYIGDSIPGLAQYTVFQNGIPEYLKQDIEKCQAIKELIVPVSKLGSLRGQIYIQGTREYLLNKTIRKYARR